MTDRSKTPAKPAAPQRKSWITPRVDRIRAGEAEVGTRVTGDGAFSTS